VVILQIVAPGAFGGLERVVQLLGAGLVRLGHEVHVVAVAGPTEAGANEGFLGPLADAGVQTHPLVVRGRLEERAAVARLCRELRPHVVHTHGYRPDVLDADVARRLGIPVVTTVHGFTGGGWRNRVYEWLQCRAFRGFDAVVAVSRPLVSRLTAAGVSASRIHEVPNAWGDVGMPVAPLGRQEARRLLGLPADDFVVGWVGRLSPEKGADVLLGAIPYLKDLPLAVSFVGDGAERLSLAARARGLGLNGQIHWHGAVAEAGRFFSAFDVFVLSSRTEGTPIVLFEAMAAGVPIVATEVGGVPYVVSPAEAALVAAGYPAGLATEIRAVHRAPEVAQRRACAARTRLERDFNVAAWLDRYVAIYLSVSS
jgi:glycosyltransferase involved in cell wall biosynthesis